MRDVVDARKLDADENRARNGRFSFHDAAFADSFLRSAHAYHVFAMARAVRPLVHRQKDDCRLRGFADRIQFASPCRNGAAAVVDCSPLNDEAASFQREPKGVVGRGLLGVNPDHQHGGGAQEVHQPVKRDLEGFECTPPPIHQRYCVLPGRMAAVRRGCRASIAAAMQLQHQLDGLGPGYDDSVLLGATCKRNHRFNDAVACGSGTRGSHDVTILI